MSDCKNGYKKADIYLCKIRCEFIKEHKPIFEYSNQCCCECGLFYTCENKCDMNGNNDRRMVN